MHKVKPRKSDDNDAERETKIPFSNIVDNDIILEKHQHSIDSNSPESLNESKEEQEAGDSFVEINIDDISEDDKNLKHKQQFENVEESSNLPSLLADSKQCKQQETEAIIETIIANYNKDSSDENSDEQSESKDKPLTISVEYEVNRYVDEVEFDANNIVKSDSDSSLEIDVVRSTNSIEKLKQEINSSSFSPVEDNVSSFSPVETARF